MRPRRAAASTSSWCKALAEKLTGADVFRITLTAFLDAHTFDTRRVMKCCLAHLLPSGHVVPFCAYNTLYRDGHVPLPPLADGVKRNESIPATAHGRDRGLRPGRNDFGNVESLRKCGVISEMWRSFCAGWHATA